MAKLIFTSRYLKNAPPAKLANYVEYIATREGVEKIDTSKRNLDATQNQHKLIRQLVRDIPETKEMLEYEDYCLNPTIGNATEFITQALEQNLNLIAKRENYVDYIANRPRVERIGEHGLFTDAGTPVILSQVQKEAADHKGVIWTHVISLRREDATRLGYDSGEQWRDLIRSKRAMFSKCMKIDSANLRWFCAFHNESHHPHIHLMVYSTKTNEGYLSKPAIEAMRSEVAHDIFRQDFAHIYKEQNQARESVKKESQKVLKELLLQIGTGTCENQVIGETMLLLAKRLSNTKGKKVYGYLKADVKSLIDQIVDELAKEERIAKLYQAWGNCQEEIYKTYSSKSASFPPLVQQKQFKCIKNMVIAEALNIGNRHFTFEDESFVDSDELDTWAEDTQPLLSGADEAHEEPPSRRGNSFSSSMKWWSEEYKQARAFLYGSAEEEPDFQKAHELFLLEAQKRNALAMHDLGRMNTVGLGREIDTEAAANWYEKALHSFHAAEEEEANPYLEYRIGKMYAMGLGTEQNYGQAADWFWQAVRENHKYAQYSLAALYYRGQGVEQDYELAFDLYQRSAAQENPYAHYEVAKMFQAGIGTAKDGLLAKEHFCKAFIGFVIMEGNSHDDKLQYRIGQMFYTGTGTEKDMNLAAGYFEQAAKLGNVHAQYMLGKVWLETGMKAPEQAMAWIEKAADSEDASARYALAKIYQEGIYVTKDIGRAVQLFELAAKQDHDYAACQLGKLYLNEPEIKDIEKAIHWLTVSSDLGNQYAQYSLAKLYQSGAEVPVDISKAIGLFTLSARQGNEFAAYQLGKLYLSGEAIPKDIDKAIDWLTISAEQGNQFAQYALGKLYFFDGDVPRDKEKSLHWFGLSAAQGNIYAQYLIENINRNSLVFLAATRLMHQIEKLFFQEYQKTAGGGIVQLDHKRRRKLQEKKRAMGHAHDDHSQQEQLP